MEITESEWGILFESLRYTKEAFQKYEYYPSREFKQGRIKEVDSPAEKLKAIKTPPILTGEEESVIDECFGGDFGGIIHAETRNGLFIFMRTVLGEDCLEVRTVQELKDGIAGAQKELAENPAKSDGELYDVLSEWIG